MPRPFTSIFLLVVLSALSACGTLAPSGSSTSSTRSARFCETPDTLDARQQSQLFQFANHVRRELSNADSPAAVISRTGVNLRRLGIRFTHSGIAVQTTTGVGWRIRQLYYSCDEARPHLYDQGIGGFLSGSDDPDARHVSIIVLDAEDASRLKRTADDKQIALSLLGDTYSANAFPFSVLYQNCNQWVVELLAAAWGRLPASDAARTDAQDWLRRNDYLPRPIQLSSHWLKFVASLSPMIHLDDHPEQQSGGLSFAVSLPRTIESFIRQQRNQSQRIELCHNKDAVVIRRGWKPIEPGCRPELGDQVIPFA